MKQGKDKIMATWIEDKNGNRCSVERWGSHESAQKVLASCSGCSRCSGCSGCSRCSDCSDCSRCSDCSGCSRCSGCSGCSRCSDCSGCSGLENTAPAKGDYKVPIVPVIPNIHKRIYAAVTAPSPKNPLDMRDWHTCEMTHCRGGWVVTLAGDEGKALEKFHGTLLAAQLIYEASDTSRKFNPCRFFDSNEEALE